jgi:hypothetical protein
VKVKQKGTAAVIAIRNKTEEITKCNSEAAAVLSKFFKPVYTVEDIGSSPIFNQPTLNRPNNKSMRLLSQLKKSKLESSV